MSVPPQVKWYQKDSFIGLIIEIVDPKRESVKVDLTESSVHFEAESSSGKYEFDITLYKKVDPNRFDTKIKDRRIKVVIAKAEDCHQEWSRLTPDKHRWLKFDVDSVDLTDEETIAARKLEDAKRKLEDEHGPLPQDTKVQHMSSMLNSDDITRDLEEAEKEMYDMLKNSYLTIYNSVVWLGYFYVFFVSLLRVAIEGTGAIKTNYATMSWLLRSCQQTVFLEIIHSVTGLTKTSTFATFAQVVGRAIVLFCVVDAEPSLQTSLSCYLLVVAWCAVEVVRYPYYIVQIYELYFPKLMWLRYNVWVPLYPIGLICEASLVYQCIELVSQSGRLTVTLPNSLNVAFDFSLFLKIYLAAPAIGGLFLLMHMGSQRTKAMKKLAKLKQMEDVYHKQKDLIDIRKKKESKKAK
ncbi:uncharacterized protein LOC134814650 [Bolinopsis microptera]|uniref:uncharacterized protein LOC134814650 n=1 Tax=Bolinopsis microptera TaxID=2820187 RepID=UPI003079C13A